MRRRTLLRAAGTAGLAAAVGAGGCASSDVTQVAVVYSSSELTQFRTVLAGYHHPVQVISAGDEIDAYLRARHRAGTSPDLAVLSRPGLITGYADDGWLTPLNDTFAVPFAQSWTALLRAGKHNDLYGAWIKAGSKSLFWFLDAEPLLQYPPTNWDALVTLVTAQAKGSGPAPLAIGAADGWVLTDWLENVLAGTTTPEFYRGLVKGIGWDDDAVGRALTYLGKLWSIPGAFPGGPQRALSTQFDESVLDVTSGKALMVFEADFTQSIAAPLLPAGRRLASFPFPRMTPQGAFPLVVTGDAAIVLGGSPKGRALLSYLISPEAIRTWIKSGGYLSPSTVVLPDQYPGDLRQRATVMQAAGDLRFDLSDQIVGDFGGEEGVGMWEILQQFFSGVAVDRAPVKDVVATTLGRLARAAESVPAS